MSAALESAIHWETLAASEISQAEYQDSIGRPYGDTSVYRNKAATYLSTARALRLEHETGKPHCSVCFRDHANHQHGYI